MTNAEKDSACVPPVTSSPNSSFRGDIHGLTQTHAHTQNVHTDSSTDTQDQPRMAFSWVQPLVQPIILSISVSILDQVMMQDTRLLESWNGPKLVSRI